MRIVAALILLGVVVLMEQPFADAAEQELNAALQVMGYGYKVKVLVNGADTGVQGGKSEGKRLFNKSDPTAAKASPEIRARNFVLVPGANEIAIEYSKIDPKSNDQLEITLEMQGYPQPLLKLVNRSKASDKVAVKVMIEPKVPSGFKPLVIGDPS